MLLYLSSIEFPNVLVKRKKMSTNISIHEYSFDCTESPWTSIYQQQTNTSQNTCRHYQDLFYTFLMRAILSTAVWTLHNWYAGMSLKTQFCFQLRNLQITFFWWKRVIWNLEPSNNVAIRGDLPVALLGFNDLRRSVTPTFLFRNRFYLQVSPYCSKMNKKSMWEVKKKIKISVHGIWNPAILQLQGAWNYGL